MHLMVRCKHKSLEIYQAVLEKKELEPGLLQRGQAIASLLGLDDIKIAQSSTDQLVFQKFINSILPKNISQYFIVDGDDFKKFAEPTSTQTKMAIETLLKLKSID